MTISGPDRKDLASLFRVSRADRSDARYSDEGAPDAVEKAEKVGAAFHFWYLAVSIVWILGTDAVIDHLSLPTWVGSAKDIGYLLVCGFVLRQGVKTYLAGVRRSNASLIDAKRELVGRLAMAAEYRDDETGGHNHRIARTAQLLGIELGLSKERTDHLFYAAALHDLGKIAVPDGILHKPGPLTPEERTIIQRHAQLGADLLSNSPHPLMQMSQAVALSHHERWDGGGYPRGLGGEEIPLEGRIVAVCDVFDALTSDRPYKKAWTVKAAAAEILKGSGSQFDPTVVAAFLRRLPDVVEARVETTRPWDEFKPCQTA